MKTITVLLFLLTLFIQTIFSEETHQADREQLKALLVKLTSALNSQNMEELTANLSKDFRFTTLDQKMIKTPDELKKYYADLFKSNNAIIKSYKTSPTIDEGAFFLSDSVCFCVGSAIDEYSLSTANEIKMPIRWSSVMEKVDGVWKIKLLHLGANFYDNPVITTITSSMKTSIYIAAIFAFILGILSQILISSRLKKK